MNQLLVPVRAGRRRAHQLEGYALELAREFLIGLRSEGAQHAGLIQRNRAEPGHVNVPVAHALVVGDQNVAACFGSLRIGAHVLRRRAPSQQLHRVALEFLAHAQRENDQRAALLVPGDDPAPFQLLGRLAKTEALEQRPASAAHRPHHRVALMRLQRRVHRLRRDLKPALRRDVDLLLQKIVVFPVGSHPYFLSQIPR